MKCAEVHKDIYLFNELDGRQQQVILGHINTCAGCKRVFDEATHSRQAIQRTATTKPFLQDSHRFSNQVMSSIRHSKQRSQRTSIIDALADFLSLQAAKYSMAALSIVFVGFFLAEFTQGTQPQQQASIVPAVAANPVRLNTASFFQQFQKVKDDRQNSASISKCLIDCRHTPQMDCSSCKTKFLNLIKHHEKI